MSRQQKLELCMELRTLNKTTAESFEEKITEMSPI
jgi:hypothetical protein